MKEKNKLITNYRGKEKGGKEERKENVNQGRKKGKKGELSLDILRERRMKVSKESRKPENEGKISYGREGYELRMSTNMEGLGGRRLHKHSYTNRTTTRTYVYITWSIRNSTS